MKSVSKKKLNRILNAVNIPFLFYPFFLLLFINIYIIYIILLIILYKAYTNIYIGWEFQQDNAKIHKSNKALLWFKHNKIRLFTHPPYSPNLNPIENIWSILKNRLNKRYNWRLLIIKKDKDVEAFKRIISEEWENIPQEIIDNCILSMP